MERDAGTPRLQLPEREAVDEHLLVLAESLARRDQPDLELRGRRGRGAAGGAQHQRRVAAAREPGQLRGPRAEQRRRPALGAAEERRDFARDGFGALGRDRPQQDPRVEQDVRGVLVDDDEVVGTQHGSPRRTRATASIHSPVAST